MVYTYPGQVFDNRMQLLSGYDAVSLLNIYGVLTANVNINSTGAPATGGRVVHIESITAVTINRGRGPNKVSFEMGAASAKSNNRYDMPMFLWSGTDRFDVIDPGIAAGNPLGGSVATPPDFYSAIPSGNVLALPAIGGIEIEVAQNFDTSRTYFPGQPLRCVTSNTDVNAGCLTNANAGTNQTYTGGAAGTNGGLFVTYTDTAVGFVSRGAYTNSYGRPSLALYPTFLPGTR